MGWTTSIRYKALTGLGVLLVSVLAACGGGEDQGTEGSVPSSPEEASEILVRVSGAGGTVYSGNYGTLRGERQAVENTLGEEPQEYEVEIEEGSPEGVSAVFQKTAPGAGELKAEIVADGEVVVESTTRARTGSVLVDWISEYIPQEGVVSEEEGVSVEEAPEEGTIEEGS